MLTQAETDFTKARNKALFNTIQHLLNPEEAAMISFKTVKQILKPQTETYAGMQVIPIDKIVGSEGRYKDFDNKFFPKNTFMKERWEHVDEAVIKDIVLPPIKVYELGGIYFVRDGNHRVSVAKSKGIEFIDAEEVGLSQQACVNIGDAVAGVAAAVYEFYLNFGVAEQQAYKLACCVSGTTDNSNFYHYCVMFF